jgi:hypothetical protein
MAKMYVANDNGDWWEHNNGKLYAVSASDLKKHLTAQGDYDASEVKNLESIDKLDDHIKAAGKKVSLGMPAAKKTARPSRSAPGSKTKKK